MSDDWRRATVRSTRSVTYKIGPVDAEAARQWTENALPTIAAIRRNPAAIPIRVPPEVLDSGRGRRPLRTQAPWP